MEDMAGQAGVAIQKAAVRKPRLREATLDDYPDISRLLRENGLEARSPEEWRHRCEQNPALDEFDRPLPIGWVLDTGLDPASGPKVVGFIGNIPAVYELHGRKIRAACAGDWAVSPEYRSSSMFLLTRYFAQKGVDLFLTTTARQNSAPAFTFCRARKIPVETYDIAFFAITHHDFAGSLLMKKNIPAPSWFGWPISLGLQGIDFIKGMPRCGGAPPGDIRLIPAFDERFDVFWEKLAHEKRHVLLATRSARYLDWHFHHALRRNEAWIMVCEQGGQMAGYAIFYRQDNPLLRLKRMRLVDLQVLGDDVRVVNALLCAGVKKCRESAIHMLEIVGFNGAKRRIVEAFGFHQRKLDAWPFFYRTPDAGLAVALAQSRRWDPCLYDGDGSL